MGRVTATGQVRIPAELRRKHNLLPHTDIEFVEKDGRSSSSPSTAG